MVEPTGLRVEGLKVGTTVLPLLVVEAAGLVEGTNVGRTVTPLLVVDKAGLVVEGILRVVLGWNRGDVCIGSRVVLCGLVGLEVPLVESVVNSNGVVAFGVM